jgi:hypothetical protein
MPAHREAILALARLLAEQCIEDLIAQHIAGDDSDRIEEGSSHESNETKAPAKRRKSTKKASQGLREVRR